MIKNIVVSGITKGIGAAIAKRFLKSENTYNLYGFAKTASTDNLSNDYIKIVDTIFSESLKPRSVPKYGDLFNQQHCVHIDCVDVQNTEQIKEFANKVMSQHNFEQTHILVNNVGIYCTGSLFTEPNAQWHELFKVNLDAAYYLTKYLYSTFRKGTHIFNICSIASKEIVKEAPSYSISKMALYGLHKAMVQELEPLGIKVTAVLPGAVYTNSWKDAPPDIENMILPASDIADLVWNTYHLASQSTVREIEIKPLNF
jgi:short-subunit dehydrogenase